MNLKIKIEPVRKPFEKIENLKKNRKNKLIKLEYFIID